MWIVVLMSGFIEIKSLLSLTWCILVYYITCIYVNASHSNQKCITQILEGVIQRVEVYEYNSTIKKLTSLVERALRDKLNKYLFILNAELYS